MLKHGLRVCCVLLTLTASAFAWTAGSLTVDLVNSPMDIKVSASGKTLAEITAFTFGAVKQTAITAVQTTPDSLILTLAANYSIKIVPVQGGIRVVSTNPAVTTVTLTLKDQGEHFYGITEHNVFVTAPNLNTDLRGQTVQDKMYIYAAADEDAMAYSSFYYTTLGYAGFFDTWAYGTYVFGVSGQTTITHNTSAIDWYLFYGPTLSKIQQSYYKIIGAPKKLPMWACGPLVWHDNFTGSAMMLTYAANFVTAKIPFSTMWLDRPYNNGTNGWSDMNFEGAFGNPQTWIPTLTDSFYVNLVTWISPCTFGGTYPAGAFTSTTNYYLDLTNPSNVSWYENKVAAGQYPFGVRGHKMDRVDNGWPSGPTLPAFYDGTPAEQRHMKYVYLNAKVTDTMLRSIAGLGENQFNFPRAAVPRCQQYISAIWNGDSYGGWAGMVTCIANAVRAGEQGWPMWGSDICGYNQKSLPAFDNYCRWLEFGVYSGFMELMLDGKEPWTLTATQQDTIRTIFNLRFSLLPYIYSILNTSADNGVSMKPLVGEYPDDASTYTLWDEYLFGPFMLVAPIYSSTNSRSLYLPAGKWINSYNLADTVVGPKTITSPALSHLQIPVYIKSNSLYPTGQVFAGLARKWNPTFDSSRTVTINAFPGAAGENATFTYVDYIDGNKNKSMTVSVNASNTITVTSPALTVAGNVVVRLMTPPTNVYLGQTAIASPQYDATAKKLTVPFAANQSIAVTINGPPTKEIEYFEPVAPQGRMLVRHSDHGIELILPRMNGIHQNSSVIIGIVDIAGRIIINKKVTLNQFSSTPVTIKLGKSVYFAKMEVNGVIVDRTKIVAQ